MAKFAAIAKGHRARRSVPFPLSGAKWNPSKTGWDGETLTVDLRVLRPADELDAIAAATARAKSKGIADPGTGEPIYDYALRVETLLRACVDPDSPQDAPEPFFASFDEIVGDELISREHIAYLFEQQAIWQSECSPRAEVMSQADFEASVFRTAGGDMRDFLALSPAMQWSFTRSTALLAANSLRVKSGSSSSSTESLR